MKRNKINYYACLAAGAKDAELLSYMLTWDDGTKFNPRDDSYIPYLDPNFGFHLKINNLGFIIDFGNGSLDTRLRFLIEPFEGNWITSIVSNEETIYGIGTFYESFYRCLINLKFGNEFEDKF